MKYFKLLLLVTLFYSCGNSTKESINLTTDNSNSLVRLIDVLNKNNTLLDQAIENYYNSYDLSIATLQATGADKSLIELVKNEKQKTNEIIEEGQILIKNYSMEINNLIESSQDKHFGTRYAGDVQKNKHYYNDNNKIVLFPVAHLTELNNTECVNNTFKRKMRIHLMELTMI